MLRTSDRACGQVDHDDSGTEDLGKGQQVADQVASALDAFSYPTRLSTFRKGSSRKVRGKEMCTSMCCRLEKPVGFAITAFDCPVSPLRRAFQQTARIVHHTGTGGDSSPLSACLQADQSAVSGSRSAAARRRRRLWARLLIRFRPFS